MTEPLAPANLRHRLGAIFYDALLIFSLLFVVTGILVILNKGEAIPTTHWLFRLFLLATCFMYFGWFWTHGGQTLGMRSWRLLVSNDQGQPISWWLAFVRFNTAILSWGVSGLGFLWCLFDGEQRCWHDILSGTQLYRLPK